MASGPISAPSRRNGVRWCARSGLPARNRELSTRRRTSPSLSESHGDQFRDQGLDGACLTHIVINAHAYAAVIAAGCRQLDFRFLAFEECDPEVVTVNLWN